MKICGLILAAGASSRLGRPKQLLQREGKTLLEASAETALAAGLAPVYVVLGAQKDKLMEQLKQLPVQPVFNPNWQEGIGSSIRCGLSHAMQQEEVDAVLIMLCDQLLITSAHLHNLVEAYKRSRKPIVATSYHEQKGVPALFDLLYFPKLLNLKGDTGARKIILQHAQDVHTINFDAAAVDIDTAEDALDAGLQ